MKKLQQVIIICFPLRLRLINPAPPLFYHTQPIDVYITEVTEVVSRAILVDDPVGRFNVSVVGA